MSHRCIGAALCLLLVWPATARAGECLDDEATMVGELEQVARGKLSLRQSQVYCLGLYRFGGTNRRAGPRAARRFRRLRRSRLRSRVIRACRRIINRGKFWPSRQCARLLADYGVKKAGKLDTFTLLTKYYPHGPNPRQLAALGDRRATALLIKRFSQMRSCYLLRGEANKRRKHCTDFTRGKRNRWTRKAHVEFKIEALNALWHLADPASRAFLKTVVKDDPTPLVRQRAARVLARLKQ